MFPRYAPIAEPRRGPPLIDVHEPVNRYWFSLEISALFLIARDLVKVLYKGCDKTLQVDLTDAGDSRVW